MLDATLKLNVQCPAAGNDAVFYADQIKRALINLAGRLSAPFFTRPMAVLAQKYLALSYRHLLWGQWHKVQPHWFDHRIDLHTWSDQLNPHWLERGVYSKEVMFEGCRVLDIACGDGFYAHFFYASVASLIDCVDTDIEAISHAKKYHHHPKIRHCRLDAVNEDFPLARYDTVCLDGALAHFSFEQLNVLLPKIKKALGGEGVFSGYEEMERGERKMKDHKIVLSSEKDFQKLLSPYFNYVRTFYLESPGRKNMYFRCSDSEGRLKRF